jgi:hypothetical protein
VRTLPARSMRVTRRCERRLREISAGVTYDSRRGRPYGRRAPSLRSVATRMGIPPFPPAKRVPSGLPPLPAQSGMAVYTGWSKAQVRFVQSGHPPQIYGIPIRLAPPLPSHHALPTPTLPSRTTSPHPRPSARPTFANTRHARQDRHSLPDVVPPGAPHSATPLRPTWNRRSAHASFCDHDPHPRPRAVGHPSRPHSTSRTTPTDGPAATREQGSASPAP